MLQNPADTSDLPSPEPVSDVLVQPGTTSSAGPLDVRNAALIVLAVMAGIFMLHWAQPVLVPLLLGLTLSYALAPVVNRLERWRLPRPLAAALVLLTLLGAISATAIGMRADATAFIESLPDAAQKIRQTARAGRNEPESAIAKVQKAANALEQAANENASAASPTTARGVTRVQIERRHFSIHEFLIDQMPDMVAGLAQAAIVVFLTFFLLASGDSFRRKIVRLAGPTFTHKKITVQALDEVTDQVQRYLLVQVVISLIVGVATWLSYWIIGMDQPAVWGVLGMALNFIPYIGSGVLTLASALAAFVQFGSVDMAALVGGTAIVIHILSGNLLTPWLTSRTSRLNPVAVFVGVLVFGWLWGIWGLLLGTPMLLIVKAICDRVDDFRLVAALLER
ncbi:MAG: AI-2E family transporter [Burkholderiaceae bacterium]